MRSGLASRQLGGQGSRLDSIKIATGRFEQHLDRGHILRRMCPVPGRSRPRLVIAGAHPGNNPVTACQRSASGAITAA